MSAPSFTIHLDKNSKALGGQSLPNLAQARQQRQLPLGMKRQRSMSPQRYHRTTPYERERDVANDPASKKPYPRKPLDAEVDDLVSQLKGPAVNGAASHNEASRGYLSKDDKHYNGHARMPPSRHDNSPRRNNPTLPLRDNSTPPRPNTSSSATSTSHSLRQPTTNGTNPALNASIKDLDTRLKSIETNNICSMKYAGRIQSTVDNTINLKQTIQQWEESGPPKAMEEIHQLSKRMDAVEAAKLAQEQTMDVQNKGLAKMQEKLDTLCAQHSATEQLKTDQAELALQVAQLSSRTNEQATDLKLAHLHTVALEKQLDKVRSEARPALSDDVLKESILRHVMQAVVDDSSLSKALRQSIGSSTDIQRNKQATIQLGQLLGTVEGEIQALKKRVDERGPVNVSADIAGIKDNLNGHTVLLNQLRPILSPQALHNAISMPIQKLFQEYARALNPVIEKNLKEMVVKLRQEFAPQLLQLAMMLQQPQSQSQPQANLHIPGPVSLQGQGQRSGPVKTTFAGQHLQKQATSITTTTSTNQKQNQSQGNLQGKNKGQRQ